MASYRFEWKESARKEIKHIEHGTLRRLFAPTTELNRVRACMLVDPAHDRGSRAP